MDLHLGTRERLLVLLDDVELIAKALLENALAPKAQKMSQPDHTSLVELLLTKESEYRETLIVADEQAKIEQEINSVKAKSDVRDREIHKLQLALKEAEFILSTAIFQARQKITSINQANKRPVSSEELIKYAHRISAANAVSAPLTWTPGDIRRPYPTDVEMRGGFLGKSDLNINGAAAPHAPNIPDAQRNPAEVPNSFQNQFNWNNLGELHMSMGASGSSVALETRAHKEASQDDVEVMSTDSSSSSSSDSQ